MKLSRRITVILAAALVAAAPLMAEGQKDTAPAASKDSVKLVM